MAKHKSSHNSPKMKAVRTTHGEIRTSSSGDVTIRKPRNIGGQSKTGHGNPHQRGK